MIKRISWKKGMRLTDDLLKMSDEFHSELVHRAFVLAASGRFGLLPSSKPFHISLNFDKESLEIEELTCSVLTKDGSMIEMDFDTRYSCAYDNKVVLPASDGSTMLLIAYPSKKGWMDSDEDLIECEYAFSLIPETAVLPDNAFPLSRIVHHFGWRIDENFVPPCLLLSSHNVYKQLADRFQKTMASVEKNLVESLHADCKIALAGFWPAVRQLMIDMDKELDMMTPMQLLASVQKFISAFICACMLDPLLKLSGFEEYDAYTRHPYDYRNVYQRILEGLDLCDSIEEKSSRFSEIVHEEPAPEIVVETPSKSKLRWMGLEI